MSIINELKHYIEIIDDYLFSVLDEKDLYQNIIYESMRYSIFTGGKRLRPIICIKSFELFNDNVEKILPFAAAIEMIHTYSLIHDDLPSMDNDDFRRGKLTNHKVYGEAMAILAGDGLLNLAYETMNEFTYNNSKTVEDFRRNLKAINEIGMYSGTKGMIGGQVLDILGENSNMDEEKLLYMYKTKTAGLIQSALVTGAIIGGASDYEIEVLREFGLKLGLAYQIEDDILDHFEDTSIDKFTYLKYYSIEKAEEMVKRLSDDALETLKSLEDKDISFFKDLTKYLICRKE